MYAPTSFSVKDRETILTFIQDHSFACLITCRDGRQEATHLPFLYREPPSGVGWGSLVAHMARANPQWKAFSNTDAMVIFTGPHGYISPDWYHSRPNVPTWNYTAVHITGRAHCINDEQEHRRLLRELTACYEGARIKPWQPDEDQAHYARLIKATVAFEIAITRVEAKFKLGQNKSEEDRRAVVDELEARDQQDLARLMRATLN